MDDFIEHKKVKGTKKCLIKRRRLFKNYQDSLLNNKIILQSQKRFKNDHHNVYTEQFNKTAPNNNGNKRLQTFDKMKTYAYGTSAFKICESEFRKNSKIQMINFDDYANENKTELNLKWPYIPDHPYRILIIGGSGSRTMKTLITLIRLGFLRVVFPGRCHISRSNYLISI